LSYRRRPDAPGFGRYGLLNVHDYSPINPVMRGCGVFSWTLENVENYLGLGLHQ
jgi:hypothetical protein